jgi:hypothetical protein
MYPSTSPSPAVSAPWDSYEITLHPSAESWVCDETPAVDPSGDGALEQAQAAAFQTRAARWALQAAVRDMLQSAGFAHRVSNCFRSPIVKGYGATVWTAHADGRCSFHGLQRCGSVWACPICEAKIAQGRAAELALGLESHMSGLDPVYSGVEGPARAPRAPGAVLFVTLTIRHGSTQPLAQVLRWIKDARKEMRKQRYWKAIAKDLGVVGSVVATEFTFGLRNGWHPHFHELLFLDAPIPALQLPVASADHIKAIAAIRSRLFKDWRRACRVVGVPPDSMPIESVFTNGRWSFPGVHVEAPYHSATAAAPWLDLATYLADHAEDTDPPAGRWGLDAELAKGPRKAGRGERLHPWDFARLYTWSGDSEDHFWCARLVEFLQACSVTRTRSLVWSDGLRARLGLQPERSSAELAGEGADGPASLLADIPGPVWSVVRHVRGAHASLLLAAETGGLEGLRGAVEFLLERAVAQGYKGADVFAASAALGFKGAAALQGRDLVSGPFYMPDGSDHDGWGDQI